MQHIIEPHGSSALHALFVADSRENDELQEEAQRLPSVVVSSAAAANAVMLGAGYFNPLTGYMNKADALSVARDLKTTTGLFWPVPVLNLVKDASALAPGKRVALHDPNVVGAPVLAVMDVEAIETLSDEEVDLIVDNVFRTSGSEPPGRRRIPRPGAHASLGPDQGAQLQLFPDRVPRHVPHRCGNPQRDRRARLEQGGRLPDSKSNAPRA